MLAAAGNGLLQSGVSMTIGDIADACGFVSQAHFAARYQRYYGRSPRETRWSAKQHSADRG